MTTIMCDHPAWTTADRGATRVVRSGASTWLIASDSLVSDIEMTLVDGPRDGPAPEFIQVDLPVSAGSDLGLALAPLVPLVRVRNPSLWDATATAILGRNVEADPARAMYRRLCTAFGIPVETQHGLEYLFPNPEGLLRLSTKDLGELKVSFAHAPLQAAATAYLERGAAWSQLDPAALVAALQSVPGIGLRTAGVAVADFSGDFSVYPYPDRAIRTNLRRATPATDWLLGDAEFRTRWRTTAGGNVSALTQLVLAWGQVRSRLAKANQADQPFMGDLPEPIDLLDVLQSHETHRVRP